jgi:SAM-dependent methyltransferase
MHVPSGAAVAAPAFECRNCLSRRGRVRYTFAGVDAVIRECVSCSLMVLDPLPTEEDLKSVYNEGYFHNEHLAGTDVTRVYGYIDYISERINKQRGYRSICRTLQQLVRSMRKTPKLLDIGCGLGFFLDTASEFGFRPDGIEFNEHAIEYIRRRYPYRVSQLGELRRTERYDVVTMFDVIEHLREPFATLDEAWERLEDNGVLVIVTMDSTSLMSRLMGKRLEDFRRIREHLFFFSRANLIPILRHRGFEIVRVASKGHSFEVGLLAARLRTVLPAVGSPLCWLVDRFPSVRRASVYLNPRTKFIVYARKPAQSLTRFGWRGTPQKRGNPRRRLS